MKAQTKPKVVVEKGNNAAIRSVRYSPDGRFIITTCPEEGTVKVWETASGRLLATLSANEASDAWYSETGRYIAVSASDGLSVYNSNQAFLYAVVKPAGKDGFLSFARGDSWMVTSANDDSVADIRNADNGNIIRSITTHHSGVMLAKLCDNDTRLIVLSDDSVASLIDLRNDSVLYEQKIPGLLPKTILLNGSGAYAAIACYGRKKRYPNADSLVTTLVWETATGRQVLSGYSVAALSPDNALLIMQNEKHDTTQTALTIPDGKPLFTLPIPADSSQVVFSKDDRQIYGYVTNSLQTFDSKTGEKISGIHIPEQYVAQALVRKMWFTIQATHPGFNENNVMQNFNFFISQHLFSAATFPAISPDGKKIALGFSDGTAAELSESHSAPNTEATYKDSLILADKRFAPIIPGVEQTRVLHNDGITLFTDPFNPIIDAEYVPQHPYIFTKTWDNQGIIWNNRDITIRYKNDLNYFGITYTDLNQYAGSSLTLDIKPAPSVFSADGRFFSLFNSTGKTLWKTDSLRKIFPVKPDTLYDDGFMLFQRFSVSPDGTFTCNMPYYELDVPKLLRMYRMDAKSGAKKEIHAIPWSSFYPHTEGGSGDATEVSFAGDSRHLILWFGGQWTQAPFSTKLVALKDGISLLAINPQIPADGNTGITGHDSMHASYSKTLQAFVICTNRKLYWISASNGQIIKTLNVQLKQPQITRTIDFNPDSKLAFYEDGADGKIYAIDVKTGRSLYSLHGEDNSFSTISFSPDHSRFVTLTEDQTGASVWETATGGYLTGFTGHTTRLLSAVYSADGKFILCCAQDGSYEKRDAITGKLIYTFFLFRDFDFAIVLPEGYYYSSSRSDVRYLNFRLNNKLYNFSQFDLQFNRPDKILQAMGSTDTTLISAWRKAWIKRITNSGFREADFDSGSIHVPEVSLLNKEKLPQASAAKNFFFYFSLSDSRNKITHYNIYVNDVPLYGVNGKRLPGAVNNTRLGEHVLLDSGVNKIEIGCTNEKGADSHRESFYITYNPAKKEPSKTWFIGIGINKYSQYHYLPDLLYCVNDIRDLATAFKAKYGNIEIDTLLNEQASRQNILALKKVLMQTGADDRVIISFNGHGISYHGDFYFATPLLNPQSPEADGISYADMQDLLDSIPARKKLLLIDACHSGESDADDISGGIVAKGLTYAADTIRTDLSRGSNSVEIIDVKADDNGEQFNVYSMMKNAFIDLRKNNGAVVIAASQSRQQALEKRDYGNGLFTHCVLNQFGIPTLNVSQLLLRINEEMQSETSRQQSVSRQELSESDWTLW